EVLLLVGGPSAQAATGFLRGRPRGRLRGTTTPWSTSWPPQTPQGSFRSSACSRHWLRIGQSAHSALAGSTSSGSSANHRSAGFSRHGRTASVPMAPPTDQELLASVYSAFMTPAWLGTLTPSSRGVLWTCGLRARC